MPSFSSISRARLDTCHPDLQRIMEIVVKVRDIVILEGHRNEEAQNIAFHNGASDKQWPESKHNKVPSLAVDIGPWPLDWKDEKEFYLVAGIVLGVAHMLGIKVRWGGRWKKPHDCPHVELLETEAQGEG